MALLTTQTPGAAGIQETYTAASATDTFAPDNLTFVRVINTNASTRTITIGPATTYKTGGQNVSAMSNTIAATTGTLIMGPFPANQYADPSTGVCTITPSATAGVSYAVVRIPVISP